MIFSLLLAIISIVLLMIIHEFGHFIIAKKFGVKVEEFGIGYPPRIYGRQFGDTLYSINWIPFGAFVKIYGEEVNIDDYRSFSQLAIWKRILICLGGVLAFWLAAMVIFTVAFGVGAKVPIGDQTIPGIMSTELQIVEVAPDSPAEKAGLRAQDTVVNIQTIAQFQALVQESQGKEIHLIILRDQKELNIRLTPRLTYPEGQGPTGVALERFGHVIEKSPWYLTPIRGIAYTGQVTGESLVGLYGFFKGLVSNGSVPKGAELAGPVGITIFISQASRYGLGFFLYFIGSLTVLLAIFNLFPIPALDGGKIIFLFIEKIMKKPVPIRWEQGITVFFFFLLIAMSLFITIRFDIPRVIDIWKMGL